MNSPLVYVIIINWNGRDHLDACFASLIASSYEHAVFLLVDNASNDDSVAHVQELFGADPRVRVLALSENRGWSGGNNAGIERARKAGAEYILLLNNDTSTDADAIRRLVARMEADGVIGALAPRMVLFDQPDLLNSTGLRMSIIGAAWDIGIGRLDEEAWHAPEPIVGVCGGAMFLRAAALDRAGLFPEEFEIYLDDLDLCLRLWNAGFRIERCAEAVVRHKFSATMGTGARARRKYYLNTRNRFRIVLRHFPMGSALSIAAGLGVGEARALGRAALSGAFWRIPAHLRAWCAALAYLPAARRFRRTQNRHGNPPFWPWVLRSPLFCPALVLPESGWYPPIVHEGASWRPMARRAWLNTAGGALQVSLVNCYPALGDVCISIHHDGMLLGVLSSPGRSTERFDVPAGRIEIVAESTFVMEDTGGPADVGAWIQIQCDGRALV